MTDSVRQAALAVVAVHARLINAVTPGHPDFLHAVGPIATHEDAEKYSALFSQWHATTRALREALAEEAA